MDSEVATKVLAIVASVKRVDPATISPDAAFEELGIDSLDRLNILFELENTFDIDVPDDEAKSVVTVKDMIDRLESYLQRRTAKGA
jgi:acyl carrier protein